MMWENMSGQAEQAMMSFNDAGGSWDLSRLFYDNHQFTAPYGLVTYFESHDQERLQFKNGAYGNVSGTYNIKDLPTGLKRDEMGVVFMLSSPGPKMVWQFGERGYDVSIGTANQRLDDKPPHWEYMSDPDRHHLYQVYSRMIRMKVKNPVFTSTSFTYNLTGAVKTIQMLGQNNTIEVIGNFDVVPTTTGINFPTTGTWYDNFSGTSINVTSLPYNVTLAPGEYHLYSKTALSY
jgi:hypothetical protein